MMTAVATGKREQNTARTREKLIDAAVQLYGSRSIDAVSLRQISVAAGQKNSNALQYHFHNREGLLQAIVDKHACAITEMRQRYIASVELGEWSTGEAAARCLVLPIVDYVEANPDGLNYVKIVSQIAALHQNGAASVDQNGIQFPKNESLVEVFVKALATVPPREIQRRVHLVVEITFHTIAGIYRASELHSTGSPLANKKPMVEQLVLLLNSFFSAPALDAWRRKSYPAQVISEEARKPK